MMSSRTLRSLHTFPSKGKEICMNQTALHGTGWGTAYRVCSDRNALVEAYTLSKNRQIYTNSMWVNITMVPVTLFLPSLLGKRTTQPLRPIVAMVPSKPCFLDVVSLIRTLSPILKMVGSPCTTLFIDSTHFSYSPHLP